MPAPTWVKNTCALCNGLIDARLIRHRSASRCATCKAAMAHVRHRNYRGRQDHPLLEERLARYAARAAANLPLFTEE